MTATLIDNTALREANVNWAGAGGQFSVITAIATSKSTIMVTVNIRFGQNSNTRNIFILPVTLPSHTFGISVFLKFL